MSNSLKIGVLKMPPMSTSCALDDECSNRGLAVEAVKVVCQALKFNCTLEWYDKNEYGSIDENGNGTGMIGAIQRGEFDTSLPVFSPTYQRHRAIGFSDAYFYFDMVLVTRAPSDRSEIDWRIVYCFQWIIWFLVAVQLIFYTRLLIVILHKTSLLEDEEGEKNFSYFEIGMCLVTNDFRPSRLRPLPIRVAYGFWLLCALVISSSFVGILFSEKVVRNSNLPFTDLASFVDCLEIGRCRTITHTESINFHQQLIDSGSEVRTRAERALLKRPALVVPLEKIPEAILKEQKLFFVWHWPRDWVYYSTKGNENCSYYLVNTPYSEIETFPVRKNSSLLRKFNQLATPFIEYSINQPNRRKYLKPNTCDLKVYHTSDYVRGTTLYSIRMIFYFYALGIIAAVFVIVLEILRNRNE